MVLRIAVHKEFSHLPGGLEHFADSCTFPSWHQCSLKARRFSHSPHYPSQKQWLKGIRGKQEPPRRGPPGAPTCSHPHGWVAPTTCWLKSPHSLRALAAEREGETPGRLRIRPSKVHPAVTGKAHLQGLISNQHGQTMGNPANAVFGSTLRQSGCLLGWQMTIHWPSSIMLPHCQVSEATENPGTGPRSSRARPKDQPLWSQKCHWNDPSFSDGPTICELLLAHEGSCTHNLSFVFP